MKALSIRNPWAWYILNAGKTIKNRSTRWAYRGPVLIHVGASLTKDEYRAWRAAGESMRSDPEPRAKVPEYSEMQRGGFVGIVRIVDCTQHPIYDRDPAKNIAGWRMGSDEHGPSRPRARGEGGGRDGGLDEARQALGDAPGLWIFDGDAIEDTEQATATSSCGFTGTWRRPTVDEVSHIAAGTWPGVQVGA